MGKGKVFCDLKRPGLVIQTIAKVFFVLELVGSLFSAIISLFGRHSNFDVFWISVGVLLSSFIIYAFVYGFGRLVDNSDTLVEQLKNTSFRTNTNNNDSSSDELPEI